MPLNTTGINNVSLPLNGSLQPFKKFTRFFAVPESHWYSAQIQSDVNQFISVQFSEQQAVVNVVNSLVNPSSVIKYAGNAANFVTQNVVANQTLNWNLQGNGKQLVWINADSIQNSQSATITVQSLQSIQDAFAAITA